MLIVVGTYVIHLFIPQFGWLDEEQEKRLFSGYSSFAQVAFPIVAILFSPWVRRIRKPNSDQSDD